MIARVDAYLERVLQAALPDQKVKVTFDSPPGAASASRPTLNLLLFDVREELDRRGGSEEDIYEDARRVGAPPPTRWYRLRYLLTAEAADRREEHRILGELVEGLPGPPFERGESDDDEPVLVELALPTAVGPSITDVWSALGTAPRASLEIQAITRVRARVAVTGAPVEHLVLDVARTAVSAPEPTTKIIRRWGSRKINEDPVESGE